MAQKPIEKASDLKGLKIGEICAVKMGRFHPTQMTLGPLEIARIREKMEGMSAEELEEYLEETPVPIVIGPKGKFCFVLDRHHHTRAAQLEKIKAAPAIVTCNWYDEDLDYLQTLQKLMDNGMLHPFDQFGEGPRPLGYMPQKIYFMATDPYRDLSRRVLRKGGFEKTKELHAEMKWANYLRPLVPLILVVTDIDKAVDMAIPFCKLKEAGSLPGFLR